MLIPISEIRNAIPTFSARGVIHVGACQCEEANSYRENNIDNIVWIEANPDLASFPVYQGLILDTTEINPIPFYISNNLQSSSILKYKTHAHHYNWIHTVKTFSLTPITLTQFVREHDIEIDKYDFLNVDVQGTELRVLQGAIDLLPSFKYIYLQIYQEELYENCSQISEVDAFLVKHNFAKKLTKWTENGWGDALYVRNVESKNIDAKNLLPTDVKHENVANEDRDRTEKREESVREAFATFVPQKEASAASITRKEAGAASVPQKEASAASVPQKEAGAASVPQKEAGASNKEHDHLHTYTNKLDSFIDSPPLFALSSQLAETHSISLSKDCGAIDVPIPIRLNPQEFVSGNTTIIFDGTHYIVIARLSNWVNNRCVPFAGVPLHTLVNKNVVLRMNTEFQIVEELPLIDVTKRLTKPTGWTGFEDIRLYETFSNGFRFLCTLYDHEGGGISQLARGTAIYDGEWKVVHVQPLARYGGPQCKEKNWLAFHKIEKSNETYLIYHWYPKFVILRLDAAGACTLEKETRMTMGKLHEGSCSPIWCEELQGWIALVHLNWPNQRRFYHRIVLLSKDFEIMQFGPFMYFSKQDVEYACGMIWSHDSKYLIFTYGLQDSSSRMCLLPKDQMLKLLSTEKEQHVSDKEKSEAIELKNPVPVQADKEKSTNPKNPKNLTAEDCTIS